MKKVGILGVPLGYGAGSIGSELGVNAMRLTCFRGRNLIEHIRGMGYEVVDHGDAAIVTPDLACDPGKPRYLREIVESSRNVISSIKNVFDEGEIPIIIGGDHAIAIPTFSAISSHFRQRDEQVGLIWFDAHADINTPETSPSGNVHGMPLAVLLGHGNEELTGLEGFSPKLDAKRFAHIGARDVDGGEREMIHKLGLRDHFFTMSDIDTLGMAACVEKAIDIASDGGKGKYAVTFDVDMIDPTFAPGSGTLVRGGTTYREAHLALEMIARAGGMASFEIVEVNPMLDQSNITVELACELVLSAFGKTIL